MWTFVCLGKGEGAGGDLCKFQKYNNILLASILKLQQVCGMPFISSFIHLIGKETGRRSCGDREGKSRLLIV